MRPVTATTMLHCVSPFRHLCDRLLLRDQDSDIHRRLFFIMKRVQGGVVWATVIAELVRASLGDHKCRYLRGQKRRIISLCRWGGIDWAAIKQLVIVATDVSYLNTCKNPSECNSVCVCTNHRLIDYLKVVDTNSMLLICLFYVCFFLSATTMMLLSLPIFPQVHRSPQALW